MSGLLALAAPPVQALAPTPTAYITDLMASKVSVLDTATNTVTATIPVGSSPIGVAASPDAARVYVTNNGSDSVSVIDEIGRAHV